MSNTLRKTYGIYSEMQRRSAGERVYLNPNGLLVVVTGVSLCADCSDYSQVKDKIKLGEVTKFIGIKSKPTGFIDYA